MEPGFSPYTSTAMVHGQVFRIIARKPPTRGSSLSATWGIAGQLCCKSRAPVNHHRFPRVFNLKNNNRIFKKKSKFGKFFFLISKKHCHGGGQTASYNVSQTHMLTYFILKDSKWNTVRLVTEVIYESFYRSNVDVFKFLEVTVQT